MHIHLSVEVATPSNPLSLYYNQLAIDYMQFSQHDINCLLIWGVVKLSATSDHLPYLCPTRLLALATPLLNEWNHEIECS